VPIVHGFRFGDETVFFGYLQWNDVGRVRPFEFYDRVMPSDSSVRQDTTGTCSTVGWSELTVAASMSEICHREGLPRR
jgi:hypothetical protein